MLQLEIGVEEVDEEFNPDDIDFLIEEGVCEDEESAKGVLRVMRLADRETEPVLALCVR